MGADSTGAVQRDTHGVRPYTGVLHDSSCTSIDNEIHHRGQGYVYLRALGKEPPPFYERN